jgi:hypothetical protein
MCEFERIILELKPKGLEIESIEGVLSKPPPQEIIMSKLGLAVLFKRRNCPTLIYIYLVSRTLYIVHVYIHCAHVYT